MLGTMSLPRGPAALLALIAASGHSTVSERTYDYTGSDLMTTRRSFLVTTGSAVVGAFPSAPALIRSVVGGSQQQEIIHHGAGELARMIRGRQLSAEEVVVAHLNRIEVVNPTLNAVVQLRAEAAVEEARAADRELAAGRTRGPLHGVPMTLKDSIDTADLVTTGGTLGRQSFVPERDATVTTRLRDAGAILLGKTNTPEMTWSGETENLVYGRTANPYDVSRTPGGSSGGPAAIVAAFGSPFDIGSDTGGSIRWPAHCCGITGIKPTSGRVPRTGHIVSFEGVLQSLTQLGPMARTVDDLSLILQVIAGPDGIDPFVADRPLDDPGRVALGELRVAFYTDNGIATPTPEISAMVRDTARALRDIGARVSEARPPGVDSDELFGRLVNGDIGWLTRMLERAGTTEHGFSYLDSIEPMAVDEYTAVVEEWDAYRSRMLLWMSDYDVILTPTAPTPATRHGDYVGDETETYLGHYNLVGWPSASVRAGTSPEGLPLGVHIVGSPWQSDVVLAVAKMVESEFGPWPGLPL